MIDGRVTRASAGARAVGLLAVSALVVGLGLSVPAISTAGGEQYGTIKGRLVWGGDQIPEPKQLVKKGDPNVNNAAVCAVDDIFAKTLVVDPDTGGIQHGFAYLVNPQGTNPEAEQALLAQEAEVEIDQINCEFVPYSMAFHQNQKLVLKSSDPINHNVRFSAFVNPAFNQILPPNGQTELQLVAERRPMELRCDIHPWMKGWMMVFDHPFFVVTGEDGSFEIRGVPPGAQNLIVWQESAGYVNEGLARGLPVTVQAGEVTDVGEITLDPSRVRAR